MLILSRFRSTLHTNKQFQIIRHRYLSEIIKNVDDEKENILKKDIAIPKHKLGQCRKLDRISVDLDSLIAYKQLYGHMVIKQKFSFSDYEVDGIKFGPQAPRLGVHVKEIRQRRFKLGLFNSYDLNQLNELGFIWHEYDRRFDELAKNLKTYEAIHGNLLVPSRFVIPKNDIRWDMLSWGKKLGKQLSDVLRDDRLLKLKERGINIQYLLDGWAENIKMALQYYRQNKGVITEKFEIQRNFIVPEGDNTWPTSIWGMKLGQMVKNIRHSGYYSDFHDSFENLGLTFEPHIVIQAKKIELALLTYKSIYFNNNVVEPLQISSRFIVPEGDSAWPTSTWGMKLGRKVSNIRHRGDYADYHDRFKEIGLVIKKQI